MSLRQLFRPVYGEQFHVRPKQWWNPRARKAARLAAVLADYQAPQIRAEAQRRITHLMVYGEPEPPSTSP